MQPRPDIQAKLAEILRLQGELAQGREVVALEEAGEKGKAAAKKKEMKALMRRIIEIERKL